MAVSVAAVMRHCRNYFVDGWQEGVFRITGNALPEAVGAHYIYISGSMMHDGVWEVCNGYLTGRDVQGLENEEFDGRVYFLKPPVDFLDLCREVSEYDDKCPVGAYVSESFGEYQYSRASVNGAVADWVTAYKDRLVPFYKPFPDVR